MCTGTASDQSGHDPFRALKFQIPKAKASHIVTTSLKAAVSVLLIFSISLALYSLLHTTTRPDLLHWHHRPNPTLYMTRLNSDQSPTNISHIAFGLAGSTQTWEKRGYYSDLWWKPNITNGFVFLEDKVNTNTQFKIQPRVSSDWRSFRRTAGSESAVRIARVLVDLFRVGLPNVRWFVMGDDDTVFFAENLVAVLGKYDHRRMMYVGGNSESVEQDVMHAYDMAFGGGGFAVSYPLAVQVVAAMDGCLDKYHYFYGSDQRVWACVGDFGVGLTREPGFHQFDIRGDPLGLLTAHPLAPLVSLHHLDYVDPLFPNRTQLEAVQALMGSYEVDPSRTLQHCFCYHHRYKWSVSISWGYTVQIYPILLTARDLEIPVLTFKTWRSWKDGPFTFNTRPASSDPCQQPVTFYLDSVHDSASGGTVTTYKKFVAKPVKKCDWNYARAMAIEKIIVTASRMDPHDWNKAQRRQCCDIKGSIRGTMRIRIRKCEDSETVTF